MSTRQLQRWLYFGQRTLGDYEAAKRGRLGKRLLRRTVTRNAFRLFR